MLVLWQGPAPGGQADRRPWGYICDECIELCNDIIVQEVGRRPRAVLDSAIESAAREALEAVDRLRVIAQQARAASQEDDPK